jgi:hypothetical protein
MKRATILVTALACLILAVSASRASADPVVAPGGGGVIETTVRAPGSAGTKGAGSARGEPVGTAGTAAPPPCTYVQLTPELAIMAGLLSPDGGGAENIRQSGGSYYRRDCSASGGGRAIVWIPDGTPGAAPAGVPVVTPAELALEARNRLQLPAPEFGVSPDGLHGNPALVNLPTWWWITNAEASLTQRTQAGPVWAEVTATPFATSWVASDGTREDCPGLGIAWQSWMKETQFGSCRFTYTRASEEETATIQTVWKVTWVGSGGSSGQLDPIRVETTHTLPVYERQAILTAD